MRRPPQSGLQRRHQPGIEHEQNGTQVTAIGIGLDYDERTMGALMMHYILETIFAAELWGIDAFDQPAVEDGKVLTRQYLSARRRT